MSMYDRFDRSEHSTSPFGALDAREATEELVRVEMDFALDDLPRVEVAPPAAESARRTLDLAATEVLSTSLPINARAAYETFCDAESIPRWLSVVTSVHVLRRNPDGRVSQAAFVGRMRLRPIRYSLFYRYAEPDLAVTWSTEPASSVLVAGRAQFLPLGERATLMQYQLILELGEDDLPWEDPFSGGHATSLVMNDFREYVIRTHRP